MRDYESAYGYYRRFMDIRQEQDLDVYRFENAKIGLDAEAGALFQTYLEYAARDESIYRHLSMAIYHSYMGNTTGALEHLRHFVDQDNFHYWTILFLEIDPLTDPLAGTREYERLSQELRVRFWENHRRIRASLEEKRLL